MRGKNDGFSYILTGIYVYSKYTITCVLKSKTATKVLSCLKLAIYKLGDSK